MKVLKLSAFLFSAAIISSCTNKVKSEKPDILRANLDTTINPGKDFYLYANGGWFNKNPIPESESRWGIANLVKDELYINLRKISEDAAGKTNAEKNSTEQRIGDLYTSAMDSAAIEKAGIKPLENELKNIDGIRDINGLTTVLAHLHSFGVEAGFSLDVSQDEKNSSVMALHLSQGGLGMPNRDYYFNNDSRTKNIREKYADYLHAVMPLIGQEAGKGDEVISLEMELASASRKLEDLRDPYKNYHKMSIAELNKLTPSFNWNDFLKDVGVTSVDSIIVGQPEFFAHFDKTLKSIPIDQWKNYLKWHLVNDFANKLGGDFDKAHFNFYGTVLTGAKTQKPRWKRVIDYENDAIGELLGKEFVKEYFPAKTKKRYEDLVNAILSTYKEHLQNLPWMSQETKVKALQKLSTVTKKIGYPDKWKDFTGMEIAKQAFVLNAINVNNFWFNYSLKKLGKPVNRQEWDMNPQEYNAYYNPSNNEIVLPAAAFAVPGFKDDELDDALVYGYAGGSTIGHEITHGFDDEGRQYDDKGNLHNWWTKEDAAKFDAQTKKYVDQFNKYVVLDSMHVNGKATLGENIADLGGIVIGLDAFKKTEAYKKGGKIGGLTPIQRYFLGYALGWMIEQRKERLANQILTDVHAPAMLRVNGPLSNIPEFYDAFGIKEGSPLWRPEKDRVVIW